MKINLKQSNLCLGIVWFFILILDLSTSIISHHFSWITIVDLFIELIIAVSCLMLSSLHKN